MRPAFIFIIVTLVACQANAQKVKNSEVPENIKNELFKKYTVKKATWSKEPDGYEASFKENEKEVSIVFSSTAEVLEVEREIKKSELPKTTLDILQRDFPDYKIEEVARIESKGVVTYEVEVEKGEVSFDLIFDATSLIKKIEKEKKD